MGPLLYSSRTVPYSAPPPLLLLPWLAVASNVPSLLTTCLHLLRGQLLRLPRRRHSLKCPCHRARSYGSQTFPRPTHLLLFSLRTLRLTKDSGKTAKSQGHAKIWISSPMLPVTKHSYPISGCQWEAQEALVHGKFNPPSLSVPYVEGIAQSVRNHRRALRNTTGRTCHRGS